MEFGVELLVERVGDDDGARRADSLRARITAAASSGESTRHGTGSPDDVR